MRAIVISGTAGITAATAFAGWVAAQPTGSSLSATTFRRAAQVRLADTQATQVELRQAKLRPSAVALRRSLTQTAGARVDLAAVDRAALPVLAATRPTLVANLRVFPRAASFTASATEPGMTLVIDGSKTATAAPAGFRMPRTMQLRLRAAATGPVASATTIRREALTAQPRAFSDVSAARSGQVREVARPPSPAAPPAAPTLQDVAIERTEYGLDISFVRFGAVYNMAIACDAPETDPRCSDEGAKALAQQLEVVGGGTAQ